MFQDGAAFGTSMDILANMDTYDQNVWGCYVDANQKQAFATT